MTRWVDERQRDLLILLNNDDFIASLKSWLQGSVAAGDALRVDLDSVLETHGFDGISVVDTRGEVRLGIPDALQARTMCRQAALQSNDANDGPSQVSLSFAFDGEKGYPKLDAIGAAHEPGAEPGRRQATLCMRIGSGSVAPMATTSWC